MTRQELEKLFYGKRDHEHRFTQDFPVLPDVWFAYADDKSKALLKNGRLPLLLTPHNMSDAPKLAQALRARLETAPEAGAKPRILYNESVVLAEFSFQEMCASPCRFRTGGGASSLLRFRPDSVGNKSRSWPWPASCASTSPGGGSAWASPNC